MRGAQVGRALATLGGIVIITVGLVIGLRDVEAGSPPISCGSALASDADDAANEAYENARDDRGDIGDRLDAAQAARKVCSDAFSTPRWISTSLLVAGCLLLVLPLTIWLQAWLGRRQERRASVEAAVTPSAATSGPRASPSATRAAQPPGPPPGWFQINGEWRWWNGNDWANQVAPPPPPSGRQSSSSTLTGFAFVCALVALVFLPVIFGPIGVVLGAIGASRGERGGGPAVAFALFCTALGMYFGYQSVISDY